MHYMQQKTLKMFNELMGIGSFGDYEAHSDNNGILSGKVVSSTNSSLLEVSIKNAPSELDIYTSARLLEKYLDFFAGNVDIRTNETSILLYDDKTEAIIPMATKENAIKNTKSLKRSPDYTDALILDIPIEDFKFAFKASAKFEEYNVKFEMNDYLTLTVGNFKRNLKELTGPKGIWYLRYDLMEEILKHAIGTAKVYFKCDFDLPADQQTPVKFEYTNGMLSVIAYIMRLDIHD